MINNILLHTKNGTVVYTYDEIIENALEQKRQGVAPSYAFAYRDSKGNTTSTSARGWLVWSTWEDGAGVVICRDDGKMVLLRGWQSDFVFC